MKKFIIAVSAVALVVGGGYSALWYHNAGNLVKDTESSLALVGNLVGPQALTYSSINKSGFPGDPAVTIKDIKINALNFAEISTKAFTLKRGIFTNCLVQESPEDVKVSISPAIMQGQPIEWDFKTKDGKMKVSFTGHEFMNFVTGKLSLNPLKDKDLSLANLPNILLNDFKSIESSSSSSEMVDVKTGKTLIKVGPSSSKFAMERIDPTSHKISLESSMKDFEVSPDVDKMLANLADSLQQITGADMSVLKFMRYSVYGKMTTDVALSYKGPTDLQTISTKGGDFDLDLTRFESTDALQKSNLKGKIFVKVGPAQTPEIVNIKLDGSYQANEALHEHMKALYKELAQAQLDKIAEANKGPDKSEEKEYTELLERVFTMYGDKIFPDFAKLGVIKTSVDIGYSHASKSFKADLSLLTDKYGFILKSEGSQDNKKLDLELTIKNYKEFLDALYSYSKDILEIANEVSSGNFKFDLTDQMKGNLIQLLEKMADNQDKNAKDLVLKVKVEGNEVKIGKMTAPELLMAFMMLMPQVQQGIAGAAAAAGKTGLPDLPK